MTSRFEKLKRDGFFTTLDGEITHIEFEPHYGETVNIQKVESDLVMIRVGPIGYVVKANSRGKISLYTAHARGTENGTSS